MDTHRRGSDGRRIFSPAFKQEQIGRVVRGELTIAALSREVDVGPSVIRRWKHLVDRGSTAAVAANDDVVPESELRAAQQRIRELERLLGKKAMEIEILQAARFGAGHRPEVPIQWLSDNGSIYTALDTRCTAERLNLEPITTPVRSPQSNGMSEAFVNTLKRDYVSGADRSSAAAVLDQVPAWIADYNAVAPHSALGFRAPQQYRIEVLDIAPVGI